MKYEPLKDKKESAGEILDTIVELVRNVVVMFSGDDFKIDKEEWEKCKRKLLNEIKKEDNGTEYYIGDGHVKSACEGLYEEFTKSIMESSDLDPINIVRHFGDLQKKWFSDVIE